jgi:hypothetical protein
MATYISTSSAWFYEKDSEVLFVNELDKKVGVLTDAPQYELDVRGTLYAETYCNLPAFALSNQIYPVAMFGSNVARDTSNVLNSNFQFFSNKVQTSNILLCSNLEVNNTIIKVNGSNLVDTDKKIDYQKWVKNGPIYNQDDTLAVAGLTLGALGILGTAGTLLTQNGLGPALQNNIQDLLGDGGGATEDDIPDGNDMYVHWNRITYPPFYTKRGKTEVAIQSNLYVSRKAKLCGIAHDDLVAYDSGREKRIVVGAETKVVYDFSNDTLFCDSVESTYDVLTRELQTSNIITSNVSSCNIHTSNLIATSNITCSNIQTSNIIVSHDLTAYNTLLNNVEVVNGVKVGQFFVRSDGIWINYDDPLNAYKVIDAFGQYQGGIYLKQVLDIDAIDFNKFKAGTIALDEFTVNNNSLFEFDRTALDSIWDD